VARQETRGENWFGAAVYSCILLLMKTKSYAYVELQAGRNLCRSFYSCSSKTVLLIFNFQLNYNVSSFPFLLQTQIFGLRKFVVGFFDLVLPVYKKTLRYFVAFLFSKSKKKIIKRNLKKCIGNTVHKY